MNQNWGYSIHTYIYIYIYVRSEPGRRVEHVAGTFGPCGAKRPLGVCGPLPTLVAEPIVLQAFSPRLGRSVSAVRVSGDTDRGRSEPWVNWGLHSDTFRVRTVTGGNIAGGNCGQSIGCVRWTSWLRIHEDHSCGRSSRGLPWRWLNT